jgi:guanylate kinase
VGPLLIVLSGPSGVGKDAVLSNMRHQEKPFHFTVTATTRPRRPAEVNGVDYIFISERAFRRMIVDGELLEWAEVYGHLYGVPRAQVTGALSQGSDVIIKCDVQGAATIRKLAPDALFIFLAPPTIEELEYRLSLRMTESSEALDLRLRTAEAEMEEASRFDYVVTNHRDRLDDTVREIEAIVDREGRKAPRRKMPL